LEENRQGDPGGQGETRILDASVIGTEHVKRITLKLCSIGAFSDNGIRQHWREVGSPGIFGEL
jgi:hypothetical protein